MFEPTTQIKHSVVGTIQFIKTRKEKRRKKKRMDETR